MIIDTDTLPERVSNSEIIIIGKLISLEERAIIEEELQLKDSHYIKHYTYYDVGKLEIIEVIEGTCDKKYMLIKFLSFDQTQPAQLKIDCKQFSYYDIWNIGIWLINMDTGHEPLFMVKRGNYVPMEKLEDVKKIVEKNG